MKEDPVLRAVDLANEFLQMCHDKGIHENVAQAAFGDAWFRLCFSMGFSPDEFKDMLLSVIDQYKKDWEDEK